MNWSTHFLILLKDLGGHSKPSREWSQNVVGIGRVAIIEVPGVRVGIIGEMNMNCRWTAQEPLLFPPDLPPECSPAWSLQSSNNKLIYIVNGIVANSHIIAAAAPAAAAATLKAHGAAKRREKLRKYKWFWGPNEVFEMYALKYLYDKPPLQPNCAFIYDEDKTGLA